MCINPEMCITYKSDYVKYCPRSLAKHILSFSNSCFTPYVQTPTLKNFVETVKIAIITPESAVSFPSLASSY